MSTTDIRMDSLLITICFIFFKIVWSRRKLALSACSKLETQDGPVPTYYAAVTLTFCLLN